MAINIIGTHILEHNRTKNNKTESWSLENISINKYLAKIQREMNQIIIRSGRGDNNYRSYGHQDDYKRIL